LQPWEESQRLITIQGFSEMAYFRYLSPIETTYLASDLAVDAASCAHQTIELLLEGKGSFDLDEWHRAVQLATQANPGARIRLRGAWGWRYWDDSGSPPRIKLIRSDWDTQQSAN
jgi:hypothetical protein